MHRTLMAMATATILAASVVAGSSSATVGVLRGHGVLRRDVAVRFGRFDASAVVPRKPALSIANVSGPEGNSGASTLVFGVKLSAASRRVVTVHYATADGTATAGSDYTATSGTLKFRSGQKRATIAVRVAGDTDVEQNESFSVTLSSPRNARLARASGIGTITNDDTAPPPPTEAPVTAGAWKGATQNGNYVFFTVTSSRTVTGFRVNDVPDTCAEGGELSGGVDFGGSTFTIQSDGSFAAQGSGDATPQGDGTTHYEVKLSGLFGSSTTSTGTYDESIVYKYQGSLYHCSSGAITWSATLQG